MRRETQSEVTEEEGWNERRERREAEVASDPNRDAHTDGKTSDHEGAAELRCQPKSTLPVFVSYINVLL